MLNNAPRHIEQNPILEGQRARYFTQSHLCSLIFTYNLLGHVLCRDYQMHRKNKSQIKPTMKVVVTAEEVKFQQEYKKALKAQHKTFNQNGTFSLFISPLAGRCSAYACLCFQRKILI